MARQNRRTTRKNQGVKARGVNKKKRTLTNKVTPKGNKLLKFPPAPNPPKDLSFNISACSFCVPPPEYPPPPPPE